MKRILAAWTALFLIPCLCACGGKMRQDLTHFAMDTYLEISVFRSEDVKAARECFDLIDEWEERISITKEESEIARLNRIKRGEFSQETAHLCRRALECAELTHGAFDPTLYALKRLWDIQNRKKEDPLPTWEGIREARAQTGYQRITLRGNTCTIDSVMGLDLGGIAKGYLGDLCANALVECGVADAIINMGGNVRLVGEERYRIGVLDPRGKNGDLLLTLDASDCSIVTSGDYERYVEVDGVRYHHIFDPSTGSPADSGLISVTVIGKDGALCDALSTAFFVMGLQESVKLMESEGLDVDVIFVDDTGTVRVTAPLAPSIRLTAGAYRLEVLP